MPLLDVAGSGPPGVAVQGRLDALEAGDEGSELEDGGGGGDGRSMAGLVSRSGDGQAMWR